MTSTWTAIRAWWAEQNEGWEAIMRHQRPWEQEGPLRWVRRWGNGWELHGATLPADRDSADGGPADCSR